MKNSALLCLVIALVAVASSSPVEKKKYTTKYDNINLEEILNNERLFNNYYKCLIDSGPCTPDGKELKESLPDALKNDCALCSEKQKEGSDYVFKFLIEKRRHQFDVLEKKFDPTGIYMKKLNAKMEARNL